MHSHYAADVTTGIKSEMEEIKRFDSTVKFRLQRLCTCSESISFSKSLDAITQDDSDKLTAYERGYVFPRFSFLNNRHIVSGLNSYKSGQPSSTVFIHNINVNAIVIYY